MGGPHSAHRLAFQCIVVALAVAAASAFDVADTHPDVLAHLIKPPPEAAGKWPFLAEGTSSRELRSDEPTDEEIDEVMRELNITVTPRFDIHVDIPGIVSNGTSARRLRHTYWEDNNDCESLAPTQHADGRARQLALAGSRGAAFAR